MAAFSTALLITALGLLVDAKVAPQPLVRRPDEDVLMDVGADGEMKSVTHHAHKTHEKPETEAADKGSNKALDIDMCDDDFPLGIVDTSTCSSSGGTATANPPPAHHLILQRRMCIDAAKSAGATVEHPNFDVLPADKDTYPKGCSLRDCSNGPGQCFFYNEIGDEPHNPVGTPICSRPRYLNGIGDTKGLGTDCPFGYSLVNDELNCDELAACVGHGRGDPFRKAEANASKHDEFPEGCFLEHDHLNIFWNPALANTAKPSQPVGIPVCNVSMHTKCTDTLCEAVDSKLTYDNNVDASVTP